jgi:hypothetical protein
MDTLAIKQAFTFTGDITTFQILESEFQQWIRHEPSAVSNFAIQRLWFARFYYHQPIGLHWDLHCWEFSASYVPFGQRKSYMVQLNIKSALLQDLKIQRRGNLGDQGYLY